MRIAIGSGNPVKMEAAKILRKFCDCSFTAVDADSGISEQPMSEEETLRGARNRARDALRRSDADLAIGIEGGVRDDGSTMWCFAACCVLDRDDREGTGFTGEFPLPEKIRQGVLRGGEVGPLTDDFSGRENTKRKTGIIGVLTGDVITRTQLYEPAVVFAYLPFLREDLYGS